MKVLIDKEEIKDLASNNKIYMRGRNIYNAKGRIGPIFYNPDRLLVSAKVSSLSGNVYDTFIRLNNNGTAAGAACSCASFGIFKGACKHVVALLLDLLDKELDDYGENPIGELDEDHYLYGKPTLKQTILSFDILNQIVNPEDKPKRGRGRRGKRPTLAQRRKAAAKKKAANASESNISAYLKDNTQANAKGEDRSASFIKINPGQDEKLQVSEDKTGVNVLEKKEIKDPSKNLVDNIKYWNLREDNATNTAESLEKKDRLTEFEVTLDLNPEHGSAAIARLSLRVGVENHLYVVNHIGEFINNVKNRKRMEFGTYFTWHRKQALTKEQSQLLDWLEQVFLANYNREIASMTAVAILNNQSDLDTKNLSLSAADLRSFFLLRLDEADAIDILLNLGNYSFPLVWRNRLSQNIFLFLDKLEEKDEDGKLYRLKLQYGDAQLPVQKLSDVQSVKVDIANSIILLPIPGVFIYDAVLYYQESASDRLFYTILESLAPEKESCIDLTVQETSYLLGVSFDEWAESRTFAISNAVKENIIKEDLLTKAYLDYDKKNINLSVFFNYGDYAFRPGYAEKRMISKSDNEAAIVIRDVPSEKAFTGLLYDIGFDELNLKEEELELVTKTDKGSYIANQYTLKGAKHTFDFVTEDVLRLKEAAKVYVSPEYRKIEILKPQNVTMHMNMADDENFLSLEVDVDDYSKKASAKIVKAFLEDKTFVKLDAYRYVDLSFNPQEDEWAQEISDLREVVKTLESWEVKFKDNKFILPKVRSLSLFLNLEEKGIDLSTETKELKESWQRLIDDQKNPALTAPDIPDGVEAELRPYQVEGYQWLRFLDRYNLGGILADEMGLGKTLQMLTFIWSFFKEEGGQILIIAPTSLLYNWKKESDSFIPGLPTYVIDGTKSEREEKYRKFKDKDGMIVVSYGLARQDKSTLNKFYFDCIVLDEAQNIKNPMTKTARSVKSLHGKRRFALTGTPLENHIGELWSIFDFIMPGYLFSYSSFKDRFSILFKAPEVSELSISELEDISSGNYEIDAGMLATKRARYSLRQLVSPFILRRLKEDVLQELPDKLTKDIPCPMTNEQQRIYREHIASIKSTLTKYDSSEGRQQNTERMNVLSELTRLRQIACHPALFIDNYTGGSGKLEVLEDLLDNLLAGGHRVLLFSQFTKMLNIIRTRQENYGREVFYIDGQVPSDERLELVDDFNAGEGDIFLISLRAGGTGLNLTGADVVIHYDPWWNPAVENQATDRAHRIGQEKHVQVFRLVTIGSIEEKIQELQAAKQNLLDDIVTSGTTYINKLNMDDIKQLFMD